MQVPPPRSNDSRTIRRTDLVPAPRPMGRGSTNLAQPVPPESFRDYWICLGFGALKDAAIFGCIVVASIFLGFALYNAWCDPFEYINIFVIGAVSYLVILIIAFLLSWFFGDLAGRFNGTASQSNARINNTQSHRNLIVSRRSSSATANFVRESRNADRIAQGLQSGRGFSGTGEYFNYVDELGQQYPNTRGTQPTEQPQQQNNCSSRASERCPYCRPVGTGFTIPPVRAANEENRDCDDNEEIIEPNCENDEWFRRQLRGSTCIPLNFAPCQPERLRMTPLRCTPVVTTTAPPVAGDVRNSNSNCQRPMTQTPSSTYEWPTTCQQPTTCRRHNICRSRPEARQVDPQPCATGTLRNSNSPGRNSSNNCNPDGSRRILPQP